MSRFDGLNLPQAIQRRFEMRSTSSRVKLDVLATRLAKARHPKFFKHLTIYAAGSYGRLEASKYSDIDLFFVLAKPRNFFDEIKIPEIRLLSEIVEIGYNMDFPKFSNDGHFLKLLFLDDILENLGSPADDYHNHFTARMLLLLESKPIYGTAVYNKLLRETTQSYFRDYPYHPKDFHPTYQ
jgi:predicted nucleotidyltransferase